MTREEIEELKGLAASMGLYDDKNPCKRAVILGKAIQALEQEPTDDKCYYCEYNFTPYQGNTGEFTEQESKTCKNCKWWRDHDGLYRRGIGAESQCPINRKEVFEGNGYCFLFEPQERSKE